MVKIGGGSDMCGDTQTVLMGLGHDPGQQGGIESLLAVELGIHSASIELLREQQNRLHEVGPHFRMAGQLASRSAAESTVK